MNGPRVIVVAKRSAYSRFVEDERDPRVRALLKRRDPSVRAWQPAHREHEKTVTAVQATLRRVGAQVLMLRGAHKAFHTSGADLVITVGGDGTLLAASHQVHRVPILGVNSSPKHSIGFFCAARRTNLQKSIRLALSGKLARVKLMRMRVIVNGRIRSERVLNEALFCQACPAATSRYILTRGNIREEQRSSGFWVGPAAGSTAAQRSAGGKVLPLRSKRLQLVVREPYHPAGKNYLLTRFFVNYKKSVSVHNKVHAGRLFLDGPYKELPVELGDDVTFEASPQPLTVLGLTR